MRLYPTPAPENNKLWTAVVAGIFAIGIVEALWMLLAHGLGMRLTGIGELGSIMGAIFTAGGLLVALIALYSLTQIREQANEAVRVVARDLPSIIDKSVVTYLQAYDKFDQARRLLDEYTPAGLESAQSLVEAALRIAPSLSGPRAWLGRYYYYFAALQYLGEHNEHFSLNTGLASTTSVVIKASRAINWLLDAKLHSEGDRIQTTCRLAELYGMLGQYTEAAHCVEEVVGAGGREGLLHNSTTAFLGSACGSDTAKLGEIGSLLNLELPWSVHRLESEWDAYVAEIKARGQTWPAMQLWAIQKSYWNQLSDSPNEPTAIIVLPSNLGSLGIARWVTRFQIPGTPTQRSGIPPIPKPDQTGVVQPEAPIIPSELLKQLFERFLILGRAEVVQIP